MKSFICICILAICQLALAVPKWDKNLVEAEQVALVASGFIVPPPALVMRVMKDLKVIRSEFPEVRSVMNRPKWIPGQLFARKITEDEIMKIEMSSYGPLENVKTYSFGSVLTFNKLYNPEILAERIMKEFRVKAEPNTSTGESGDGMVTYDQYKKMYTFEKGPQGYSYPGYRNRHMWKFTVADGVANMRSSARPGLILKGQE